MTSTECNDTYTGGWFCYDRLVTPQMAWLAMVLRHSRVLAATPTLNLYTYTTVATLLSRHRRALLPVKALTHNAQCFAGPLKNSIKCDTIYYMLYKPQIINDIPIVAHTKWPIFTLKVIVDLLIPSTIRSGVYSF